MVVLCYGWVYFGFGFVVCGYYGCCWCLFFCVVVIGVELCGVVCFGNDCDWFDYCVCWWCGSYCVELC